MTEEHKGRDSGVCDPQRWPSLSNADLIALFIEIGVGRSGTNKNTCPMEVLYLIDQEALINDLNIVYLFMDWNIIYTF